MRLAARTLACLLAMLLLAPAPAASATVPGHTGAFLDSEAGDYIGGGRVWELPTVTYNGLRGGYPMFAAGGSNLWFAAPAGTPLTAGAYEGAQRFDFRQAGRPGLDVFGNGRGCNQVAGRFVVDQAVYADDGAVQRFAVRFELHCEGSGPALFGSLSYNADVEPVARRLSTGTLDFATQDGRPAARSVTLTNVGPRPLHPTGFTVSPASQFSISANTCDGPLAPGGSCTVTVTWRPAATGFQQGQLTFTDELAPIGPPLAPAAAGTGRDVAITARNDPAPTPPPPADPQDPEADFGAYRIAGRDRIETAIAASHDAFEDLDASFVVLTRADGFADALAGTPLAAGIDAPLLLNGTASLDRRVAAEIQRILPREGAVVLLGGQQALSAKVEHDLADLGYDTARIAGVDRFDTAVRIAQLRDDDPPAAVFLATGLDYPDALSAGAAAPSVDAVVLLTNGTAPHARTSAYLSRHPDAARFCFGGPACAAYPSSHRLAGADRYETADRAATELFTAPEVVGIASGRGFADALSGGAHVGGYGPLILTDPDALPAATSQYLASNSRSLWVAAVYGGPAAVSDGVVAQIDRLVRQ